MAKRPAKRRAPKNGGSAAGGFYRLCRMLHAYLSAFAFLALMFFSVTGLTLNHPDWLAGRREGEQTRRLRVPRVEIDRAMKDPSPPRALAAAAAREAPLVGAYASGEVLGNEALLRLEGPRGTTDVTLNLTSGAGEAAIRRAGVVAMLNDLHKGKATGGAWRLLIDASAALFIALSVLGYVLFFSLRFRLPTALALTAVSLAAMAGAFLWLIT